MRRLANYFYDSLMKPRNLYSLEYLKYLHELLIRNRTVSRVNREVLVDVFKEIPEIIVWGDQNDPNIFEYFMENNMMMFFIMIIRQPCGAPLTYQILQALNIMLDNISNPLTLHYILSNNNMNIIITHDYNVHLDEILAFYMSLLKILSMKINNHTIHFFYDNNELDFPLLTEALVFYDHPETMIRINVRNIVLNVFKLKIPAVDEFFLDYVGDIYISHVLAKLRSLSKDIQYFISLSPFENIVSKIRALVEETCDLFQFINDFISNTSQELSSVIYDYFIDHFVLKFLWPSFSSGSLSSSKNGVSPKPNFSTSLISPLLSYYIISQILFNISYPKIQSLIYDFYFKGACLRSDREICNNLLAFPQLPNISDDLKLKGIVRNNYNIENRIDIFIASLIRRQKGVPDKNHSYNREINKNNCENGVANPDKLSADDGSEKSSEVERPKKNDLLSIFYAFNDSKTFSLSLPEDVENDREFYFRLNLFLQLMNAISPKTLEEIFGENVDSFFNSHLNLFVNLFKQLISSATFIRIIHIQLIYYVVNVLIRKFPVVKTLIENSSFVSDIKDLTNECSKSFSDCPSYFINYFLFHVREINKLKLNSNYFNRFPVLLLDDSSEDFEKQLFLTRRIKVRDDVIFNRVAIFIYLTKINNLINGSDDSSIFQDFLQFTKDSISPSTMIHSSEFDIASCSITIGSRMSEGFLSITDNYMLYSIPAPHPQYGSLTVKFCWPLSAIRIYRKNDSSNTNIHLLVDKMEPYGSFSPVSVLSVRLNFITAFSMNSVLDNLIKKLEDYNRLVYQTINAKLNLSLRYSDDDIYVTNLRKVPSTTSLNSISSSFRSTQASILTHVLEHCD